MLAMCPEGWTPDVYYHAGLIHFPLPEDIETFPGLTVTNLQDWHRGGRAVWAGTGFFDLIATERNAGALLREMGYSHALYARLWGVNPAVHRRLPEIERDIDVLFIGSINPDIWSERNRWLERLAQLSGRYRVVIASGHFGEHYVRLTNRAKIVFNRSVNGCANLRAYDGLACGALVFNESENEEVRASFDEGIHCVYYDEDDFEAKLARYLADEPERERIVATGHDLVLARHTEEAHLNALFSLFEGNLHRRGSRQAGGWSERDRNWRKALQIYCCSRPAAADSALRLIDRAEQEGFDREQALEARAALQGWVAHYMPERDKLKLLTVAIDAARRAVRAEPRHAVAQMTLAFLLLERAEAAQGKHPAGRNDIAEAALALATAADRCEQAQETATAEEMADIEGFGYPRWNDEFDAAVERAYLLRGTDRAGWARAMRLAIAWRCRAMLRDLAAVNGQAEEAWQQAARAAASFPTHAATLLRLAQCAALTGRLEQALEYYRLGLHNSPLSITVWPELAALLVTLGRREEAERFVEERLRVLDAIPAFAAIKPALLEAIKTGGVPSQ
jgi:tetratricopeptide (TPR) repeat protein